MAAPTAVEGRTVRTKEIVVIGAGPYGLSTVAHLQNAGADPYLIGKPMSFWQDNMPGGMLLRSKSEASNIAAPQKHLSIAAYERLSSAGSPTRCRLKIHRLWELVPKTGSAQSRHAQGRESFL
jgi:flavin-dependent dehydrogenase